MPNKVEPRILLDRCECSLRVRIVGDGCQYCNPEYWERFVPKSERKQWLSERLRPEKGKGK